MIVFITVKDQAAQRLIVFGTVFPSSLELVEPMNKLRAASGARSLFVGYVFWGFAVHPVSDRPGGHPTLSPAETV